MPSLLASTASMRVPLAVMAALTMRLAFSGFQSSAQSSWSTVMAPLFDEGVEHRILAVP